MDESTRKYERILAYVFGESWERLLTRAGVNVDAAACDEAREKVISLAREARPDLGDLELIQVAYAYNRWCRGQDRS